MSITLINGNVLSLLQMLSKLQFYRIPHNKSTKMQLTVVSCCSIENNDVFWQFLKPN